MSRNNNLIVVAAAAIVSATLIVPTSGVLAQGWTTVTHNNLPVIQGSGRFVEQQRAVGRFAAVETVGSEDVEIRFGATPSLSISADDNVLPLITSEVRNGTLKIGTRGSFRTRGPIRVRITTPSLESFQSSGSGNVMIHGVSNDRLRLTINGSGRIEASGRTRALDVNIHGSGDARLAALSATDVDAGLYGSGLATVRATRNLDAKVFGSGTLRYVGTPANLSRANFGSGRIVAVR